MKIVINKYFKTIRDSKYLLFYTIAERVFFFILFLIFARKYNSEYYGQIVTLFTLANFIIVFFDFGLPILIQKEISISGDNASKYFSTVSVISLVSFVFYFAFVYFIGGLFYPDLLWKLKSIIIIVVFSYSFIDILHRLFYGLSEYKIQFTIFAYIRLLVLIFFITAIIFFEFGLIKSLFILFIGNIFHISVITLYFYKRNIRIRKKYLKIKILKGILITSIPLGLAVICNYIYDKIDILMISKMLDFNQVAFYNIGYGVYKTSALFFSFLLIPAFTRISFLSRRIYAVKLFFKKYFLILLIVSVFISIILFFCSSFIIKLLYTDKYIDSVLITKILSFAIIGLALNNLTGIILNGLGLFKENMYVTLVGLILNIILNLIFIPVFGIIACAVITIITEYFIFTGDIFFLLRKIKL
jgi:O-antigen/teichoic acid export membrane protein